MKRTHDSKLLNCSLVVAFGEKFTAANALNVLGGVQSNQIISYLDASGIIEVMVGFDRPQHIQVLVGKDGGDTLNGQGFIDRLCDCTSDDTVKDSYDQGIIQIDGKASGRFQRRRHARRVFDLGRGVQVDQYVMEDAKSPTGDKAVIVKGTDAGNVITINYFDQDQVKGGGDLGIQIDPTPKSERQVRRWRQIARHHRRQR